MAFACVVSSLLVGAQAHGRITLPVNRNGGTLEVGGTSCGYHDGGTQVEDGCAWFTNGVDIPGKATLVDPKMLTTAASIDKPDDKMNPEVTPWRAPGTAPVNSPCGDNSFTGADGRDLPANPTPVTWQAGSVVDVAQAVTVNHGGGWSWRLCPKSRGKLTEDCFQEMPLKFAGDTVVVHYTDGTEETIEAQRTPDRLWSRNGIPSVDLNSPGQPYEFPCPLKHGSCGQDHAMEKFSLMEKVQIPEDLTPGEYALGWRWDCQKSHQVWLNCADVTIVAPEVVA